MPVFESKTTEPITNGEVPSQPETETVKQEGTWSKKKKNLVLHQFRSIKIYTWVRRQNLLQLRYYRKLTLHEIKIRVDLSSAIN